MSTLVLAHLGHWTTALAFIGPVVLLPLAFWAAAAASKREGS